MSRALMLGALALSLFAGCKKDGPRGSASAGGEGRPVVVDDKSRCPKPEEDPRHIESSVYDTSGDAVPDVRKVYLVVGQGRERRTVLICREADLNGDGVKDVVRFYDDEGSPVREESDRNFDGNVDVITHFEAGQASLKELDEDFDGRIETKIFYMDGHPSRIERDMSAREPGRFRTDRWEYIEDGRVVRVGTDLDGDGKVDLWERDRELEQERQREAIELRRQEEEARRRLEEDQAADADAAD